MAEKKTHLNNDVRPLVKVTKFAKGTTFYGKYAETLGKNQKPKQPSKK